MQYSFYFDSTRCTGCRTCVMACKDYKDLDASRTFRRVIDYEGGEWTEDTKSGPGLYTQTAFAYHVSLSCNHCNNPACVQVCPTGAMHKDELGLIWPDGKKCIGCGYCTMACPYHAPVIDQEEQKSSKCDGCRERLAKGKGAICVEACPLRALELAPVETLRVEKHGYELDILPLPNHVLTWPNLFIKVSDAAKRAEEIGGHIANRRELQLGGSSDD